MNDRRPPEHDEPDRDEVASAVADGEGSEPWNAAVAADADAGARVEAFRSMSAAHRALARHEVGSSSGTDARIAAALTAAGAPTDGATLSRETIPHRRPGRSTVRTGPRRQHRATILVTSAAATIAVVLAGLVVLTREPAHDTTASATRDAAGPTASAPTSSVASPVEPGAAPAADVGGSPAVPPTLPTAPKQAATTVPQPSASSEADDPSRGLPALGAFDDVGQLLDAARTRRSGMERLVDGTLPCGGRSAPAGEVVGAQASLVGTRVVVLAGRDSTVVLDPSTCAVLGR